MHQVLITSRVFSPNSKSAQIIKEAGHELVFAQSTRDMTESELIALLTPARFSAIIADLDAFTAKVITAASPVLKVIARFGVGYDAVDVGAANRVGVIVTNTPGANAIAVAELTFGFLICLSRHILIQDRTVRSGNWKRLVGPELAGKTVSLIGMGAIGSEVAKRCSVFGVRVLAYDPFPRPGLDIELGFCYVDFETALRQADFVSLHSPVTPQTREFINKTTLALMKPSAFLINTARGELINEDDLFNALQQHQIAGAALDAFQQEPPSNPRFFVLDNVIMTPHAGGNSIEAIDRMGLAAAQEVLRVLAGETPLHAVKPMPGK
jgi:D-3-phosphoglycerate dehydrogenase